MAEKLGPNWRKSSRSTANSQCVEARYDGQVRVRDSKNPTGPSLDFGPQPWQAFVDGVRAGEFNRD